MNLPKEIESKEWAIRYLDYLKKIPDEELFEAAFQDQIPDDFDGTWTTRGYWKSRISKLLLYEMFFNYKKRATSDYEHFMHTY